MHAVIFEDIVPERDVRARWALDAIIMSGVAVATLAVIVYKIVFDNIVTAPHPT